MDMSYYAVQFDTARDLLANNNPEGVTGLYAIYNSLANSIELKTKPKTQLTQRYPETIVCAYLVFFTTKANQQYNGKVISRINAYIEIQDFKQQCFKEITSILQELLPSEGIEWRFEK